MATGTLYQGVPRTLAIEWVYGPDSQPDTRNPLLALRAWLRFLDTADISCAAIEKAWCKRYASLQAKFNADDPLIWDTVASAMSASILHLVHLGIQPVSPAVWLHIATEHAHDASPGPGTRLDMNCPLGREEHLAWIEGRLAERMWKNVAKHEANAGLWTKEPPILEPTKKVHRKLLAEGKV